MIKTLRINFIFGKEYKKMKKSIIISSIIVLFILGTVIGTIIIKNLSGEKNETEIAMCDLYFRTLAPAF